MERAGTATGRPLTPANNATQFQGSSISKTI
jgi:hypothetical protein